MGGVKVCLEHHSQPEILGGQTQTLDDTHLGETADQNEVPESKIVPLGPGIWYDEIRFDFGKVDWLDIGIDIVGIVGDIGLFGGQLEIWGVTDVVEGVGLIKDLQDANNGDSFGLYVTTTRKITVDALRLGPGFGFVFDLWDIGHALSQGIYLQRNYYEFDH